MVVWLVFRYGEERKEGVLYIICTMRGAFFLSSVSIKFLTRNQIRYHPAMGQI